MVDTLQEAYNEGHKAGLRAGLDKRAAELDVLEYQRIQATNLAVKMHTGTWSTENLLEAAEQIRHYIFPVTDESVKGVDTNK